VTVRTVRGAGRQTVKRAEAVVIGVNVCRDAWLAPHFSNSKAFRLLPHPTFHLLPHAAPIMKLSSVVYQTVA